MTVCLVTTLDRLIFFSLLFVPCFQKLLQKIGLPRILQTELQKLIELIEIHILNIFLFLDVNYKFYFDFHFYG